MSGLCSGINSDHLGPHMGAGRVQIPQVPFLPTPSQFSQPPMQIEPDCMFRAYDISGTVIEQPIVFPDDPDYPGVPSAGLYPPYQYAHLLDQSRVTLAVYREMTLSYTQMLHQQYLSHTEMLESQIDELSERLRAQGLFAHAGPSWSSTRDFDEATNLGDLPTHYVDEDDDTAVDDDADVDDEDDVDDDVDDDVGDDDRDDDGSDDDGGIAF